MKTPTRPLIELRTSGLLWLINRQVFHPRGFALALDISAAGDDTVYGWQLQGDGIEPWQFSPEGEAELLAGVEKMLEAARSAARPNNGTEFTTTATISALEILDVLAWHEQWPDYEYEDRNRIFLEVYADVDDADKALLYRQMPESLRWAIDTLETGGTNDLRAALDSIGVDYRDTPDLALIERLDEALAAEEPTV